MSSELSVYERITDPMEAMSRLGNAIANSRMFGCENEQSGQVIAWHCLATRTDPLKVAKKNHIIHGRLSMRYDAMLADFRAMGGKHEVVSRTADVAEIKLTIDQDEWTERLTWEEAKKEKWPYGKENKLKDNWATPRARRQVMWARVVSEAVRVLRPEINTGVYTPEEIRDIEDGSGNGEVVDVDFKVKEESAKAVSAKAVSQPATALEPEPEEAPFDQEEDDKGCTKSQRSIIEKLFATLGITYDQQEKILAKREAKVLHNLTPDQADVLIASLTAKVEKKAKEVTEARSRFVDDGGTAVHNDSPAPQELIDEIKSLLTGRTVELLDNVKSHLTENGKAKLADLSLGQAKVLKSAIELGDMDRFFELTLSGEPAGNA